MSRINIRVAMALIAMVTIWSGAVRVGYGQPAGAPASALAPITPAESAAVEKLTLGDSRIRDLVGTQRPRVITSGVQTDKDEATAYLSGTSETAPARYVTVVYFNPQNNKAARATVSLTQGRITSIQPIEASEVPLVREDAEQALALAKRDEQLRRAVGDNLGRFEVENPGSEERAAFAAQVLPVRSANPRDPCSTDRCIDLIFRTEQGYLPVRALVDLTRQNVTVERGGKR